MSQKMLTCGKTHLDHLSPLIQSLQPVNATSNPATPAATIRRHARASIFRNPNLGIAIPIASGERLGASRRVPTYNREPGPSI